MPSYYAVYASRGNAIAAMMTSAKQQPTVPITVYCVTENSPPMYLVGHGHGNDHDSMIESGAEPVFTFTAHLPGHSGWTREGMMVWADLEEEAV